MDSRESAKILLAFGSAVGVVAAGSWFSEQVAGPDYPTRPGYVVEGVPPVDLAAMQRSWPGGLRAGEPEKLIGYIAHIDQAELPATVTVPAPAASVPVADLGTLLASADVERGQRSARTCMSCHTFEAGGPSRVGPNLHNIVGRPVASSPTFRYSSALAAHGGRWTYEELDDYLTSPAKAIPGNKMAFAGIRNPRDRANLIAYLSTVTASPPPFPKAQSSMSAPLEQSHGRSARAT